MADRDSREIIESVSGYSEQADLEKGKQPLDKVVALRLNVSDWTRLEEEAGKLGIGPTTLVRMWILERLHGRSEASQDTLGAVELFLKRAFREGMLLQLPIGEKQPRMGIRETILLQTPREQSVEGGKQGAIFYGNMVIN